MLTLDFFLFIRTPPFKYELAVRHHNPINASAKSHYRATETWVVTNNFFTAAAIELAHSNGVKLCDRNFLINYSLKYCESNQTISRVELRKGI
ncbi:restriction endonuclease [Planococcus koreensis]|uniref:restriction endonuclease n=1 Tax=Planococcus koreensis TaxID=112331 RepID=UPI0039FDB3C0